MSIEELIEGCKNGDALCHEKLVRHFAPKLIAICRRYTKDTEIANDALQETFINVFKYIKNFEGKGSFEGWMKRIAVNCSISYQKKYFKTYYSDNLLEDDIQNSQVPDVYSQLGVEDIMKLIERLPKSLYVVFNMYVVEGFSHKEIGDILDISEGTSRASLSRARAKLIEYIEEKKTQEYSLMSNLKFA